MPRRVAIADHEVGQVRREAGHCADGGEGRQRVVPFGKHLCAAVRQDAPHVGAPAHEKHGNLHVVGLARRLHAGGSACAGPARRR